jgi:hypothetical protein
MRAKPAGVVGLIGAFHLSLDTGNRTFMRVNSSGASALQEKGRGRAGNKEEG